ncbi:hypothetical protein Tco_0569824 [Tanacetum coccineum]
MERETRFNNEFDQFIAEPGESLVLVYNRFSQLMNHLKRNKIELPTVTINTKFPNYLQPEIKYVTNVRLAKNLTKDPYDDLFDYLRQYEKIVIASRAKKLEKTHDPLALVTHTSSSSRSPHSYYVTHHPSVIDYDDEYQGETFQNDPEGPLTSAIMLLAHAITQRYSTPTNNQLCSSSNIRNQAVVEKGHYACNYPKPRVWDSKYFMEQMLLAKKDEAGVIVSNKQNDFLLADAVQMEEIKELSANICMMARIQQENIDSDEGPSYIMHSLVSVGHDKHVHDSYELEQLARNAFKEAEKQQIIANRVKQQNVELTKYLDNALIIHVHLKTIQAQKYPRHKCLRLMEV